MKKRIILDTYEMSIQTFGIENPMTSPDVSIVESGDGCVISFDCPYGNKEHLQLSGAKGTCKSYGVEGDNGDYITGIRADDRFIGCSIPYPPAPEGSAPESGASSDPGINSLGARYVACLGKKLGDYCSWIRPDDGAFRTGRCINNGLNFSGRSYYCSN